MAQVGILLYDGVEMLDCCGPFEVFTTASRVASRLGWTIAPFEAHMISTPAQRLSLEVGSG